MIYIFTDVNQGGTYKFFRDLESHLSLSVQIVSSPDDLLQISFSSKDILLYQKISDPRSDSIVLKIMGYSQRPRLLIVVHDYFFLCSEKKIESVHEPKFQSISPSKRSILQIADDVVFPSRYIRDYYQQFVSLPNFKLVPHIDNQVAHLPPLRIPPIQNKTICLAIITPLTLYKGKYNYIYLFRSIHSVLNHKIEYHLYGTSFPYFRDNVKSHPSYKEDEIYGLISHCHGMLFLNQLPEMYSYALTKGINSGLPLLYSDMGAVKERLDDLNDSRYFGTSSSDKLVLQKDFDTFIEFIIQNRDQGEEISTAFPFHIPEFYLDLQKRIQGKTESRQKSKTKLFKE